MIGIDTNILLRLWLNDDPAQNQRIDAMLDEHGGTPRSILVTDVVLVEAVWTLRSGYGQGPREQLVAIRSLLQEPAFDFEDRESMANAAALFEQSNNSFADCLIVAKHSRSGCEFTATFDKRMKRLSGVRVL